MIQIRSPSSYTDHEPSDCSLRRPGYATDARRWRLNAPSGAAFPVGCEDAVATERSVVGASVLVDSREDDIPPIVDERGFVDVEAIFTVELPELVAGKVPFRVVGLCVDVPWGRFLRGMAKSINQSVSGGGHKILTAS